MSTTQPKEQKPNFPQGGKFDADGFWIMPQGDFYDPDGMHFTKDGKDQSGGYYDEQGYYHSPSSPEDQEESKQGQAYGYQRHKVFIPKVQGAKFNEAGFYELPSGAYYDPLGNYFDENGYDATGGYYNQEGDYQKGAIDFNDLDHQYDGDGGDDPKLKVYQQKYKQEKMYVVDPENQQSQKLENDEYIQQEDDEAEEKPGICVKQFEEVQITEQKKQQNQDDEEDVEVIKVSASKKE